MALPNEKADPSFKISINHIPIEKVHFTPTTTFGEK